MIKKLLTLLFFITISSFHAQTSVKKELKNIENPEQADEYLKSKKSKKNKLITFNEEKHKTELATKLFKKNVGSTEVVDREYEKIYYKIMSKTSNTYNRVSYIYLNGAKYDLSEINSVRAKIMANYKDGAPFEFLVKQYSMDARAEKGGDTGWFTKGKLDTALEQSFTGNNHELNELYTVDLPETNRYYVVLKTHEPKEISELQVLKVTERK
ncbi:peptidylprolyl isomerase [Tamlana sp. 2_MG-2023]|uniref:peptidylprolyl isomerase n=1 Tax=unclassified Tamlana TaxID=2614803 RepID=UPI0026E3EDAB|nr:MULTISPECIES: peptidylprolyl isomerase [unclassified Tamlana]MDO6759294.1 peptidylprolyl isomerase [Tamlana sp. 2_MG-2023]MDO6790567.1 peptidylprolyl isomerase [Tamlana sp. 1_MG-2023]